MSGYENSPDYGGGPERRGPGVVLGVIVAAIVIGLVVLAITR